MLNTLAFTWPGPFEMLVIAGLGLLIFGKRLPEVGRSIGKGIVEFKRGLKDVETEVEQVDDTSSRPKLNPPHKFDPYTGKPLENESNENESSQPRR